MAELLPTVEPAVTAGGPCRLTPSPDATVVFGSLAAQAVERFCDRVVVDIADAEAGVHLAVPNDLRVNGSPRLRAELRVPVTPPAGSDVGTLHGAVVFGWMHGTPTRAVELLAYALIDQALHIVALQRSEQRARDAVTKAANLEIALISSRQIGAAIGIVMSQLKVTSDVAFDLLRRASQRQQRKISDLAPDVLDTGWLDPELVQAPSSPRTQREASA